MLYQINTRVWIRRFGAHATLRDVPDHYWAQLAAHGMEWVWLMGVWRTVDAAVPRYALIPELAHEYAAALPDWTPADVIGSPYAIDRYELDPRLGQPADLAHLRARLHAHGLRLMLDFVPNHFHAESSLLTQHPEAFLEVQPDWLDVDAHTFYSPPQWPGRVFAHGKDPYFAAWQDTVQVNYQRKAGHDLMRSQLRQAAAQCDGLRCDMAMLPLNDVFRRTWGHLFPVHHTDTPEFWPAALAEVRAIYPGLVCLAEVYWDMEWTLQQQGFDFTYDKRLLDRLKAGAAPPLRDHLSAELAFQRRSARFLENHDEARILSQLDARQAQAAAVVTYTVPGLRFFHDGQWEGQRVRLPVQLGRQPLELPCACAVGARLATGSSPTVCACTQAFYARLLPLLAQPILRTGQWSLLPTTSTQVLAWQWQQGPRQVVVWVNYAPTPTTCPWPGPPGRWVEHFSGAGWDVPPGGASLALYPFQYGVWQRDDASAAV